MTVVCCGCWLLSGADLVLGRNNFDDSICGAMYLSTMTDFSLLKHYELDDLIHEDTV